MKFMQASVEHLEKHYADLSKKPFFAGLVKYMASGPVVAMVWEGLNAVKTGRVMLGETNPADSKPGTSEGTLLFRLAVTSAMDLTLLSLPTTRLLFGLSLKNWFHGSLPRRIGSTNSSNCRNSTQAFT